MFGAGGDRGGRAEAGAPSYPTLLGETLRVTVRGHGRDWILEGLECQAEECQLTLKVTRFRPKESLKFTF